ncbi:Spo11/DNA topoisomerase VI subunit A [Emericellopsis atlantica]|uniref:DNA topoisomerase (ATP-hydrolyzing) n=1 Tax=Emericellopsis atlantica TaxID=2614577 RepID=A0A9P8CML8_9HYPO|nr:Spo11/DNA topoisomerase VI subunit A [Emericellopsis atlantica]KAG9252252.1 Spo11/DNA topoisomerase VI subunit A [Emericellopsis atlantica]
MPQPTSLNHPINQPLDTVARSPGFTTPIPTTHTTADVITKIETLLGRVLDDIANKNELCIDVVAESRSSSAIKFAQIILILQLSHDAHVANEILTKRHIYYQHQELFGTQRRADDLVDRLALTLGSSRDDLHIVAASKGLVAGALKVTLQDESIVDASVPETGVIIPPARTIQRLDTSTLRWVLVVEKDAVFRSLCSSRYWQTSLCGNGLLVTAKGYPDDLTCAFLRLLLDKDQRLPMMVLVDFDPDGVNIFRCYKYGSSRQNSLGATGVHWLGIKSRHILNLRGAASPRSQQNAMPSTAITSTNCADPVAYLTFRDRRLAKGTLGRLDTPGDDDPQAFELRKELQVMLMLGTKAEIEWLDEAGNLATWLDTEIAQFLHGNVVHP